MSRARQALGRRGEDLAAAYIARLGWPLLARNWRTRGGELDLVARDAEWLVAIEVRSRRGTRFGRPEESIDRRKQRRLLSLGLAFVQQESWHGPWRVDVIALTFPDVDAPGDARSQSEGRATGRRSSASADADRASHGATNAPDARSIDRATQPARTARDSGQSSAVDDKASEPPIPTPEGLFADIHHLDGGVQLRHVRHAIHA